jgi:hypothetical protein
MKRVLVIAILTLAIAGCRQNKKRPVADVAQQQISIGNTTATVRLLGAQHKDIRIAQQGNDNGMYYFNVSFDHQTSEDLPKEKKLYLDFDMQNDFRMLMGADSILPLYCERIVNGKRGSYEYILAFEKKDRRDFQVLYHDKMFGIGIVGFAYKQTDLTKYQL